MDLNSMNSRMSANSGANAQANRAAATADPEFDAGMGGDDMGDFDDFGGSDPFGGSSGGSDPFGGGSDPFGGGGSDPFGGGSDPFGGGGSDPFGGSGNGGFGSDPFGGGGMGDGFGSDPFGGGGFGGGMGGTGGGFGSPAQSQQPQEPKKSAEDIFFDAAGKAGKASMGFFKELTVAFKSSTAIERAKWGRYSLTMGIICALVGLLLWIITGSSPDANC